HGRNAAWPWNIPRGWSQSSKSWSDRAAPGSPTPSPPGHRARSSTSSPCPPTPSSAPPSTSSCHGPRDQWSPHCNAAWCVRISAWPFDCSLFPLSSAKICGPVLLNRNECPVNRHGGPAFQSRSPATRPLFGRRLLLVGGFLRRLKLLDRGLQACQGGFECDDLVVGGVQPLPRLERILGHKLMQEVDVA